MSIFLGPIHHWLFNKILIVEDRRDRYIQALREKFGDRVTTLLETMDKSYGARLQGRPLDQLVGDKPIHGFLQSLIQKVKAGEGSLVAGAMAKLNGEVFSVLLEEAEGHGRDMGMRALKEKRLSNPRAEEVGDILKDYLLEGMPCDQGGAFVPGASSVALEWHHSTCPHRKNWDVAGAPFMEMCCLTNAWIGGFVTAVKPDMHFERNTSLASGDTGCVAEFREK